eukprot:7920519-Pyramimonas_sp.AAC.1
MLEDEESTSAQEMLLHQQVESAKTKNQFPGTQDLGVSSDKGWAGGSALQSTQVFSGDFAVQAAPQAAGLPAVPAPSRRPPASQQQGACQSEACPPGASA